MGTQTFVTYEIDDPFADERFVVTEEYQASPSKVVLGVLSQ